MTDTLIETYSKERAQVLFLCTGNAARSQRDMSLPAVRDEIEGWIRTRFDLNE